MSKIALVVGSLSRQSINRAVAQHLAAQAPACVSVVEVEIGDLPLYTQDLDKETVPAYERVRAQLCDADAVLLVSPEHNRSVPAALKNLLDIGTRPQGQSVWSGKKVAVVTASQGAYGGINAGVHLRQILQAMGANVLVAPEVYLSRANAQSPEDERTAAFLNKFAAAFYAWAQE